MYPKTSIDPPSPHFIRQKLTQYFFKTDPFYKSRIKPSKTTFTLSQYLQDLSDKQMLELYEQIKQETQNIKLDQLKYTTIQRQGQQLNYLEFEIQKEQDNKNKEQFQRNVEKHYKEHQKNTRQDHISDKKTRKQNKKIRKSDEKYFSAKNNMYRILERIQSELVAQNL